MTILPTRLLATLLCAAVLVGCAVAAAAAKSTQRPSCGPRGTHTVALDGRVRVYSLDGGVYACLRRGGGRPVVLMRSGRRFATDPVIEHVELAGAMVAYMSSSRGVDASSTSMRVLDVAERRVVVRVPHAASFIDGCILRFDRITDLVLDARGRVVWILTSGSRCKTASVQVDAAEPSHAPMVLGESPTIEPTSLHLHDGVVSWVDGGRVRSAKLP